MKRFGVYNILVSGKVEVVILQQKSIVHKLSREFGRRSEDVHRTRTAYRHEGIAILYNIIFGQHKFPTVRERVFLSVLA